MKVILTYRNSDLQIPEQLQKFTLINPLKLLDNVINGFHYNLEKAFEDLLKTNDIELKEFFEQHIFNINNSGNPLIFRLINKIHSLTDNIVVIDSTILNSNDIQFIISYYKNNLIEVKEINNTLVVKSYYFNKTIYLNTNKDLSNLIENKGLI